jgi:hypothetical protein
MAAVIEGVIAGETAATTEKPAGVTLTGMTLVMTIWAAAEPAPKNRRATASAQFPRNRDGPAGCLENGFDKRILVQLLVALRTGSGVLPDEKAAALLRSKPACPWRARINSPPARMA